LRFKQAGYRNADEPFKVDWTPGSNLRHKAPHGATLLPKFLNHFGFLFGFKSPLSHPPSPRLRRTGPPPSPRLRRTGPPPSPTLRRTSPPSSFARAASCESSLRWGPSWGPICPLRARSFGVDRRLRDAATCRSGAVAEAHRCHDFMAPLSIVSRRTPGALASREILEGAEPSSPRRGSLAGAPAGTDS
jgi:hypothetical protein